VVFLALEPTAAIEAIAIALQTGAAVWIGSDAMTHEQYLHYTFAEGGVNLTRFEYPLSGAEDAVVEQAIETVLKYHPRETVWVQRAS
jgi:hypothetical protein